MLHVCTEIWSVSKANFHMPQSTNHWMIYAITHDHWFVEKKTIINSKYIKKISKRSFRCQSENIVERRLVQITVASWLVFNIWFGKWSFYKNQINRILGKPIFTKKKGRSTLDQCKQGAWHYQSGWSVASKRDS